MTVNRTTLLDLPLPVTGTEAGTWGDTTNNGLSQYMDIAIAGMNSLTSANFTAGALTIANTQGDSSATNIAAGSAQYATIKVSSLAVNSTITAPSSNRSYRIINADATYSLTIKASGQTGVTFLPGQTGVVAFNGTDYVIVGVVGAGTATDNAVARFDGTTGEIIQNSVVTIADSTGDVAGVGTLTMGGNLTLNGGTANGVLYLNGSKVATSGSALVFDGTNFSTTGTATATKLIPTGGAATGNGMYLPAANTLAWSNNGAETMRLDSSGNLGLGVTPSAWGGAGKALQMTSGSSVAANGAIGINSNAYYDGSVNKYITTNPATQYVQGSGVHYWYTAPSGTAGNAISFTQAMTLDASGNLLVGATSGAGRLFVSDANRVFDSFGNLNVYSSDAVAVDKGGSIAFGGPNATGGTSPYVYAKIQGIKEGATNTWNGALLFGTTAGSSAVTERMRLDSSGNLGLGVTPSAWGSTYRAIDIASGANGGAALSGFFSTNIARNAYNDGTNWRAKYTADERPALYVQPYGGGHQWFNGNAFVTAGGIVTMTQAMTLDASGVLNVSGAVATNWSPAYNGPSISRDGNNNYVTTYYDDSSITIGAGISQKTGIAIFGQSHVNGNYIAFRTGNSESARITSVGDFVSGSSTPGAYVNTNSFWFSGANGYGGWSHVNGTASGAEYLFFSYNASVIGSITQNGTTAVAYNTSSDYRLKDNPQPLTGSGAFIDALKPKTWNWKADGSKGVGFIAHEVQEVSPGSVVGEKDGEQMQAMEYGSAEFIANIIAELQSLRQRVALLEGN